MMYPIRFVKETSKLINIVTKPQMISAIFMKVQWAQTLDE